MPAVTIRDVPEEVRRELACRAALAGKSLQEYLRNELIQLSERPTQEVWLAKVRARKAASTSTVTAEQILEWRDADRR